jgi:glycosyltransferase involved in cell wall biosynthesis
MSWCVVIPTYNNEKTLESVIRDVLQVTGHIIVVNDGSTDATFSLLEKFSQITVITLHKNRGKGHALQKGFEYAVRQGYRYAVTIDSDGQHAAGDIQSFISKAEELPDSLIIGSRTLPKEKLRKGSGFANRFSNFWFRLITGIDLPDTQSGFRLYPLNLIKDIRFYTGKYEFELEVLVRAAWKGIRVIDVPIRVYYPERDDRVSHFRPFRDFVRISLLNTVFVFIALFYIKPFSFRKYLKKENRMAFLKKHVLQTGDSATKITFSVMFGVFMGIVPIWGYQLITAIALAYLLRLNKFIVIVAANISIPPMIPPILYASYLTGGWILKMDNKLVFSRNISFDLIRDNLYQYLVGAVVLAVIAALCSGIITWMILMVTRKNRMVIG